MKRLTILLYSIALLFVYPAYSFAQSSLQNHTACNGAIDDDFAYSTPQGLFALRDDSDGEPRWGCLNKRPIAETGPMGNGGYYPFFVCDNCADFVTKGDTYLRKDGHLRITRMVLMEDRDEINDNRYWFLDFRGKKLLKIGPFGAHDGGNEPSVIWNKESVIIVLDGGDGDKYSWWKPGPRYIEKDNKGVTLYVRDPDGSLVPHINRTGKMFDKHGKLRKYPLGTSYPAFVYDYKTKKLFKAYIDD